MIYSMMKLRLTKSNPAKSGPCVDNITQLPSFSMLILMLNSDSSLFDRSPNFPILKDLEASDATIGEKLTCFLLLLWFFYMLVSFFTSLYIFDAAIGGIILNTLFLANIFSIAFQHFEASSCFFYATNASFLSMVERLANTISKTFIGWRFCYIYLVS